MLGVGGEGQFQKEEREEGKVGPRECGMDGATGLEHEGAPPRMRGGQDVR